MKIKLCLFSLLTFTGLLFSESASDFISTKTFKDCADHVVDRDKLFKPKDVAEGDIIYVDGSVLRYFFGECHPKILHRYILISHNYDLGMPGPYSKFLNDEKIIAWFAQNVEKCSHPKLFPIPIGVDAGHGRLPILAGKVSQKASFAKAHVLYMNFNINTYPHERMHVQQMFSYKPYCYRSEFKNYTSYTDDVAASAFVLSPRGAGLDCFRTWEAMYLNAIPIVISSSLDPLFEGLPVLIIKKWEEINEDYLFKKNQEILIKAYKLEKLTPKYWVDLIYAKKPAHSL